jgi:hypothetical protein
MIIDETVVLGEVRDRLYKEVLQSDEQGNLLNPQLVIDASEQLAELVMQVSNPKVVATLTGLHLIFGWNLGYHKDQETKLNMIDLGIKALTVEPRNQTCLIAMQLLTGVADPAELRKRVPFA